MVTLVLLSDPANLTSEVQHRRSRVPTSAERAATGRVHNGHLEPKTTKQHCSKAFAPTPLESHKGATMESIFFSSLREKFEGFKETKASTEFSATDPKKMISSARASARRLPREAGIRKAPILNYID